VLTDGDDNYFEPGSKYNRDGYDKEYNPDKKKTAQVLADRFGNADIKIILIGFRLEGEEKASAQRQFEGIESDTWQNPGRFVRVDDSRGLTAASTAALEQQPLRGRFQRTGDKAVVKVKEGRDPFRLNVTRATDNLDPSLGLAEGGYLATLPLLGSHELQLRAGDGLLLNVLRDGQKKGLQRALFLEDQQRRRHLSLPNARSSDNWVVAAHQNQLTLDGLSLRMLLSVEKDAGRFPADPDAGQGPVAQIRPGFVWFDVSA